MTRGGIEYNFQLTPFIATKNDIIFYFSSNKNVERFLKTCDEKHIFLNESLSNRFNVNINSIELALIVNYTNIEKRGFRIRYNDKDYDSLGSIIFEIKLKGD